MVDRRVAIARHWPRVERRCRLSTSSQSFTPLVPARFTMVRRSSNWNEMATMRCEAMRRTDLAMLRWLEAPQRATALCCRRRATRGRTPRLGLLERTKN